jgi:GAF domain-containing protein
MAPQRETGASTAGLEQQVALLSRELAELKEQQAATAYVLKTISRSAFHLQTVLDSLVEAAARLCEADMAAIARQAGAAFHYAATYGFPPELDEYLRSVPHERGMRSVIGRALLGGQIVQIHDVLADPDYEMLETQRRAGFRTVLGVPLLRDGRPIGVIALTRVSVRPFTDKQIELVRTFADQAVIAIENARLFDEVQSRNREVTQALEQQTATSEILRVISTSPTDTQPVFETIVRSAVSLCGSLFANVFRLDGDLLHFVASHNVGPDYVDMLRTKYPMRPDPSQVSGRVVLGSSVVRIEDVLLDPDYDQRFPSAMGWRRMLGVPMLREGDPLGVIVVGWAEPGPIAKAQEELLRTFADQAVIAIENVRLFEQVQAQNRQLAEALEQQVATSAILRAIAASPTNIEPVLQTVAESATELCDAYDATILLRRGEALAVVAHHGPIGVDFTELPLRRGVVSGRAFLDRATVHVPDLKAAEDDFQEGRAYAMRLGFRTILATPLLREDEAVGVLLIRRHEVRPFTDKQVDLLTTFANQAVIAIENVRLFEQVQARTAELGESLEQQTATAEILGVINRSLTDTQPVFDAIVGSGVRLFSGAAISIALRHGDEVRAAAVAESDAGRADAWRNRFPFPLSGEYMHGAAILERRVVDIPDVENAPDMFSVGAQNFLATGYRAITIIPLMRGNEAIGALSVVRVAPGPLSDKQHGILKTFANQAVIAIENSRLLRELRESLQQQTATADVLKVISRSAFELQTVLDTLVGSAVRLCRADKGTLERLIDGVFRYDATYGFTASHQAYLSANPTEAGRGSAVGRAMEQRRIVQIEDVLEDTEYTIGAVAKMSGFRTVLAVPLLREEELVGVFSMMRDEVRPFNPRELELVQTFADQAVIAIENSRLFQELQERTRDLTSSVDQLSALAEVGQAVSATLDLASVLEIIVSRAVDLSGSYSGIIYDFDAATRIFRARASHRISPDHLEALRATPIRFGEGAVGRAGVTGEPVEIPDVDASGGLVPPQVREILAREGLQAILALPLLREGEVLGGLVILRREGGAFSGPVIATLQTFAAQSVLAIHNARLFEEVQARTRELSRSLEDLRTAQDRLIQTEKLASLGQLTAGIAHEIKNPLNFVNNFSALSSELVAELRDALATASLDDKLREQIAELTGMLEGNLDKVVQHGRRADSIVKNMLLHSRAGSGEHRPTDINAVVEESLNLAYHGARAERPGFNITLEKNFDPQAGAVDLFPQEITRVLLNLISNGFYATAKRGREADGAAYEPKLLAATRDLGDSVEIRIRDNGTGIPPAVREKMFMPFFTTKPAGEGTGLGLSLSHDIIVKQHAGWIEVDTAPGEFTEFRIVLPRAAASLAQLGGRA